MEADVQRRIRQILIRDPRVEWVERCNAGQAAARGSRVYLHSKGFPDLISQLARPVGDFHEGTLVALELKDGLRAPFKPGQVEWLERIGRLGGLAAVLRSEHDVERMWTWCLTPKGLYFDTLNQAHW